MAGNPFKSLLNLYQKPELIPAEVTQVKHLSAEDKQLIHRIGLTTAQVRRDLLKDIQIQWDRMQIYHQVERSLEHPIVGAAAELYGNYCTVLSPLHNSTCWVTSDSPTYQRELTKLLDRIGVEESIFDWAYSTGTYGDLFIKINGIPGKGIISIDDNEHPLMTSRVDHEGALIGYYKAPLGQIADNQKLIAPWEYVHFRLLGGKKKRPRFCLRGDTKISLLDGTTPTIKEMAEDPSKYIGKSVNVINKTTLTSGKIRGVKKTRLNAELVRVYLDNDKYVDCTPDHKFLLWFGDYIEAQELSPGTVLYSTPGAKPHLVQESPPVFIPWVEVVKVEKLSAREDTYDIEINDQTPNFPLEAGVFVHNSDPMYTEFRTMHLLVGMDIKQVTTKYGTSLLMNALPCYRRLRLAEDSLLLARLSRGLIRYVWKLKVSHCLRGDTRISLMNGTTPTIQEMAENLDKFVGKYVLTIDEQTQHLKPNKIKNIKKTRLNAQLIRIYLDNDKYIDCTPDHKFLLRDGIYKEAQHLQPNDSLMPHYHCLSEKGPKGYQLVYDPGYHRYRKEHRVAVGKLKKGQIPHHKDFNKLNNDPSNFIVFPSQSEHAKFHHEHNEKYGWAITASDPKTEEHVKKVVESRKNNGKPWHSEETIKKISIAHQKEKEGRVCPICGSVFEVNHSSRKKYCNLECAHVALLLPREIRVCGCGCEETFECRVDSKKRFIQGHNNRGKNNPHYGKSYPAWNDGLTKETDKRVALNAERMAQTKRAKGVEKKKAQLIECLLNHKVVKVKWLSDREDTYDIEIENTPNFPLEAGVFVHNSSMEAVGELVDQYSTVLREARALNTRPNEPYFEEKENPMCLRGDTQIRLCNGKDVTIKEIVESSEKFIGKSVWTINPETLHIEPKQIVDAQKTRLNAQLVRVHLDNGKWVDTTPDHLFMLRDGTYKQAQDLQLGDSLMPFYTKVTKRGISGYECIYDPGDNRYHFAHCIVTGPIKRGYIRHHKWDEEKKIFDKLNNDPTNIVVCTSEEHMSRYHPKHTPEAIEKIKKNQVAWSKGLTKETSSVLKEKGERHSKYMKEFYQTEEGQKSIEKRLETKRRNGTWYSSRRLEVREAQSIHLKEYWASEEAKERKEKLMGRMTGNSNPAKKPEARAKISKDCKENPRPGRKREVIRAFVTKSCKECGEQFASCIVPEYWSHNYAPGHYRGGYNHSVCVENKKAQLMECLLNHKVVQVEKLQEREDTYDITIDGNHNFALTNGVFVHNSCIEDIFLPVWDNVGDLTYDKIGGEADIRWIKDVEDLRQQLAAALRCPLPLLGAYLKEAAGPLGSEIIEKVDINFARIARKLQRTVRNGIKRICQIHLAWMNMDPDPNLFDIQMPEMSTAEEESLKDSLNSGTDVIAKFMAMMDDIEGEGGRRIDRVEVFNYLNEKILKLEDFDLTEFITSIEAIPECKRRSERKAKEEKAKQIIEKVREANSKNGGIERKGPQFDTDLFSYVPTTIYSKEGKLNERKARKFRGWLGKERCMHVWESKFSQVRVIPEGADTDVKQGQKLLPFVK